MTLVSKRLMKWREPKIKGMVTLKHLLVALVLILIVAIPFGFLGSHGRFSPTIYFLSLGFMSAALVCLAIQPLLPGTLVQLRENMIVRGARGTRSQRAAYQDIDRIHFYRDCSYSWKENHLLVNVHQGWTFPSF